MIKVLQFVILSLSVTLFAVSCGPGKRERELSDKLKAGIERILNEEPLLEGHVIHNTGLIAQLYDKGTGFIPAKWESMENTLQLLEKIRNIDREGLNPEDYHLNAIENLAERIIFSEKPDADAMSELDILLTDAFILLTSHLSAGKTDPEKIDPQWRAAGRDLKVNIGSFMDSTLKSEKITENLQKLTPSHREYKNLKKALERYEQIQKAGGWDTFTPELAIIEKGMSHPDVAAIRKRMSYTQGPIESDIFDEYFFDDLLYEHVKLFQTRNGLTPDGVVGRATVEMMNIQVEERVAVIRANMERWRWLSEDLGDRYIRVNIADYILHVIENDTVVFVSDAIVGLPFRKTPVFSSEITYLVFNPHWNVPPTILANDIIPAVRKNPSYLTERNMKVLRPDGSVVSPYEINWESIYPENFPYRIRQEPGPANALGRVKFMFPNKYSVYIHDTPQRNLFNHTDRSFSSGCIRISRADELAEYLLGNNPEWTPLQISHVINQGRARSVTLSDPVRVHMLYLTAWADDEGIVYFRRDIYDHDGPLLNALQHHSKSETH